MFMCEIEMIGAPGLVSESHTGNVVASMLLYVKVCQLIEEQRSQMWRLYTWKFPESSERSKASLISLGGSRLPASL